MVKFNAIIKRFQKQGDKTGWTYLEIPATIVDELKPAKRTSFKVKGKLDKFSISGVSLLPMGGGVFILPLNAALRKGVGKPVGAQLSVQITEDATPFQFNADFIACLEDDPDAFKYFKSLTPSHQRYFSKWIDDAKTVETRTGRIARALNALSKKMGYPEMLRNSPSRER